MPAWATALLGVLVDWAPKILSWLQRKAAIGKKEREQDEILDQINNHDADAAKRDWVRNDQRYRRSQRTSD